MALWRREPLHEKLAREGGLTGAPVDPVRAWPEVGIHGVARAREWDAVATVEGHDAEAAPLRFVALPDGSLLVEEGPAHVDPSPLAEAIERSLDAPYRAEAVPRPGARWAVGARAIDVVELDAGLAGDEIEVAVHEGERSVQIDGAPAFGSLPELDRLAEERHENYVVRAKRLEGALWEIKILPL